MNILPAPPPATDRPAPTGSATTDAPADVFGQLLAGRMGDTARTARDATSSEVPASEAPAEDGAEGDLAAAVLAAVAATRADPAGIAVGVKHRADLDGAVRAWVYRPDSVAGGGSAPRALPSVPVDGEAVVATEPASAEPAELVEALAPTGQAEASPTGSSAPATTRPDVPAPAPAPVATDVAEVPVEQVEALDAPAPATRPTPTRPTPARPTAPGVTPRPDVAATVDTVDTVDAAATPAAPPASAPTESPTRPGALPSAAVDRVLRAVELLEHAPPPRRMAIEVEGVQLTVAMQGEEVSVAVRGGADQLAPGWQRDLAAVLRGRGFGLAADGGAAQGRGDEARRGQPAPEPPPARPGHQTRAPRPAPAGDGLHL